jgi:hypothetical protein
VNDEAIKCGLLMEAAQTHQNLVNSALDGLRAHTRELDAVVRDEIRRTLVDELEALASETKRAARSLQMLARTANVRVALWNISTMTLCSAITIAIILGAARSLLPSRTEIAALTAQRNQLALAIERLEQHGARIDLRRCGDPGRYCVRVDRKSPAFGQQADYLIVAGY